MPVAHRQWIETCQLHHPPRAGWRYMLWDYAAVQVRCALFHAVLRSLVLRGLCCCMLPLPPGLLASPLLDQPVADQHGRCSMLLLPPPATPLRCPPSTQALMANHFSWFLPFYDANITKAIEKSDIARYAILHRLGGGCAARRALSGSSCVRRCLPLVLSAAPRSAAHRSMLTSRRTGHACVARAYHCPQVCTLTRTLSAGVRATTCWRGLTLWARWAAAVCALPLPLWANIRHVEGGFAVVV